MSEKDPRGVTQTAEIAIDERDWETVEKAAHELLGIARKRKTERTGGD